MREKPENLDSALRRLKERAIYGSDAVAGLADQADPFFPIGPVISGGDYAKDWFENRLQSNPNASLILFLVGGPGNGKSQVGRSIKDGLNTIEDDRPSHLDYRSYYYSHNNGREIKIVNDATAPREDHAQYPTLQDLSEAIHAENNHDLIVNINRGVIYEELGTTEINSPEAHLLNWLQNSSFDSINEPEWSFSPNESKCNGITTALLSLESIQRKFEIVAVHMDLYSLFEQKPDRIEGTKAFPHPKLNHTHRIERFEDRDTIFDEQTPAGEVLKEFFEETLNNLNEPQDNQGLISPFRANQESLQSEKVRNGVFKLLRGAEIVSATRISYRVLWETVSCLMLGDPEIFLRQEHDLWLEENQPSEPDDLKALMKLGNFRFHQAIFGANHEISNTEEGNSNTVALLSVVDPIKDVVSKFEGGEAGWANPIVSAFTGHEENKSILESIIETLNKDDPNNSFLDAVTEFDKKIDQAFTMMFALNEDELDEGDKGKVRAYFSWYGEYLLRLYAVSNGIPAYDFELQKWIRWWEEAEGNKVDIDDEYIDAVRGLIFSELDGKLVVPAFASRTRPLEEPRNELVLTHDPDDIVINGRVEGDRLFATITISESTYDLEIDFSCLRELLACHISTNRSKTGRTEQASSIEPRVERVRSSLLPNINDSFNKLWGIMTIGGNNKAHKIKMPDR